MALVYSGDPLTGTANNDFLIDYGGNSDLDNNMSGLGGNDILLADEDFFFNSFQGHVGTSVGTAFNITSNTNPWSTFENNEILNSTTIPHTTIIYEAAAAGQAYYSINVVAGATITLDVDHSRSGTDTIVEIYASDGVTLLATDDDTVTSEGGFGSTSSLDSFLQHTFLSGGNYIIRVREFGGDGNFEIGDGFVLNVSLSGQSITNASPLAGNDTLNGGLGLDHLSGGGGDDILQVNGLDVVADEYYNGGSGTDTLQGSGSNYVHDFTTSTVVSIERLTFIDPGIGGAATMRFGASQIGTGLATNAAVAFSGFSDVTDTLEIRMLGQTSINLGSLTFTGVDTVNDSVTIVGDGDDENIAGTVIRDIIIGNGGDDIINGGLGSDRMVGGIGNDNYYVNVINEQVIEAVGEGVDRVRASASFVLAAGQEVEFITTVSDVGTAAINLVGNEFAQTIIGNAGNNLLNGNAGADTLQGLGGNDTYVVGANNDIIIEAAGQGTDQAVASASYVLKSGVSVEFLSTTNVNGLPAINLTGNAFNQTITGNAGVNVLNGLGGNDILRGNLGKDSFAFSSALIPANVDVIQDFTVVDDTIRLENGVFIGLANGVLAAGALAINATGNATQADDRIIYNSVTGDLFFDQDGVGGAAGIRFADLTAGLALTNADFFVV